MICRSNNNHVTRQRVNLKQQRADYALDLARFVRISTLLAESIELVKKQHAVVGSGEVEKPFEATARLPEKTPHHSLISNDKERDHQLKCDRFGERGLSISRRTGKKYSMSWLESVRAEQIATMLLFD